MTLDLAGSELRAVHPTHLEYLANMGVDASFSVSIVAEGRWSGTASRSRPSWSWSTLLVATLNAFSQALR